MKNTTTPKSCVLIGAPSQAGTRQKGTVMAPDALRTAGLAQALASLNLTVEDRGNLSVDLTQTAPHTNDAIEDLASVRNWTAAIAKATAQAAHQGAIPITMGGDHSIAAGTIPALAQHAETLGQPLFVLWLDAHPDLHGLDTSQSGNLHGTPVAYMTGMPGFEGHYPPLPAKVDPANICMMGLRSVDPAERAILSQTPIETHDMRAIDEHGIKAPLTKFLDRVCAANGRLHVSFDVDFLDPEIACAVGTTVPGGATFREAHLIMELLHDSGLVTSLDLVELNPFLDDRGKTARLLVDLTASLMGRTVLDKPTQTF